MRDVICTWAVILFTFLTIFGPPLEALGFAGTMTLVAVIAGLILAIRFVEELRT